MGRLYDLYQEDPVKALDEAFRLHSERSWEKNSCFIWTSVQSKDGVCYGSYKTVKRAELEGRTYKIEFWDGMVSIHYTDVWFIPNGCQYVPRED